MSIRVKLYMSYIAMVIVPLILMSAFMIFIFYARGVEDVRQYFEKENKEPYLQALVYGELSYVLRNDAGELEKQEYLAEIQERLGEQWAGLLVSRDGQIKSVAPFLKEAAPNADWQNLLDQPPSTVTFNSFRFETSAVDFSYPDGGKGRALLFRRYDTVPIYWRPVGTAFSLAFIGLTSLLLTYFVSRSIIRPIKKLEAAALQIKDGDLSHKVEATTKGEIGQLSIAFEDMRVRLKQSIDQSLQYEENRKMLLSHISHDLKTPISAIKGYVEGIMDGIANTDEKRIRYMETIYRKASDMDQLIDELFLFSKLDLQTVAFDFKVIDIRRYMEHFLDEQRFDLEKSDMELIYSIQEAEPLFIAADPDKLSRVLTNILNNCVKYMGEHTEPASMKILVQVMEQEQHVLIVIEDSGPGIDEDDLPFIFDRFYRAEQSRNLETGGSGLGLAIVKQIIEGHGGTVWAENAEHGGARFCLKLPKSATVKTVDDHEEHTNH
ncbi:HAMP domain-containing sensor histidine kinase [Paenibacillus sp. LHD-38]|uniref:sensor histidine kinase n=1 Tax=Paenibacillus sp. LHD-38 TaxID=3072143 RepID=UPI00280FAF60|nr:HAMP domain-containing sensor histidine kinase [Paenibacillus sp. LHD-38]MDQ8735237.1 HAMP domain-containing sensor histidine kinase [Paenibacillus sp. LHD-38]